MSALGALEAAESDQVAAPPRAHLRLVAEPRRDPAGTGRAGVSRPAGSRPSHQAVAPRPGQLRLTRRGRIVVAGLALVLAVLALTVASMTLSGAQAAGHGRPGGGYAGMHQIVVQPGQTLWSIASRAEPSADPRQVVGQIMTANSMTGSAVRAGQLLWVPR